MVNWYREKTVVFKLKDTVSEIDYCIWKAWSNKNDPDADFIKYFPSGVVKFPIKVLTDAVTGIDGNVYTVEQSSRMKTKQFKEIFPSLNRQYKNVRVVLIGGLEYKYAFSSTSNEALKNLVAMNAGVVPAAYIKQTYFVNEAPMKKYQITVVQEADAKTWEATMLKPEDTTIITGQSKSNDSIKKDEMKIEGVSLVKTDISKFELGFIDQLKAMPNKLDKAGFTKAFIATAAKYGEVVKYTKDGVNINERTDWLFENKYVK